MHDTILLIAAGLVALVDAAPARRDYAASSRPRPWPPPSSPGVRRRAVRCGLRGLAAFFDRKLDGLGGNGRACADCHMPTDSFQLSPAAAEARFRLLQWRRRFNPNADDPLFRPVDADDFRINGEDATTSAICARTASCGSRSLCRRTCGSSIRRPTPRRPRRSWTCGAACRPSTTSRSRDPTAINPWLRGPNASGGYQLDARLATLQEQALGGLHRSRPGRQRPAAADARRSGVLPADAVHQPPCPRAGRRGARGHAPLPDADRPLTSSSRREGGIRARLRAVSWRARPVDAAGSGRSATTTSPPSVRGPSTR